MKKAKYFINDKKVKKEIFFYYLIKCSKLIAIKDQFYKLEDFKEIEKDFLQQLINGYILTINKLQFKITK